MGNNYILFTSPDSFSIRTNSQTTDWNGTIQYSSDGQNWSTWNGLQIYPSYDSDLKKIYMRGIGNTHISLKYRYGWIFTGSEISCSGNIENLLDYLTVAGGGHPSADEDCFTRLFCCRSSSGVGIVSAPDIGLATLPNDCCYEMFQNNTLLKTAPRISATSMGSYAMYYMFSGCTSLVDPPDIRVTNIPLYGCIYMFLGCTSLRIPPQILATTSSSGMYGCASMFEGCTSLLYPPLLYITGWLASYLFQEMFRGCTSLRVYSYSTGDYVREWRIPTSGTAYNGSFSLKNMFRETSGNVTGDGATNTTYYILKIYPKLTFSSNSSFTLSTYNSSKIWDGTLYYSTDSFSWSEWNGVDVLNSGIDNKIYLRGLNNTRITTYLSGGFQLNGSNISCEGNIESLLDYSLLESGNHPTMAENAFMSLFLNLQNLISSPEFGSINLANYCYRYTFKGCTGLLTAPSLPATTLTDNCYWGMFSNCTSLTKAPTLPANNLANYCYYEMFQGCTNLTIAPELSATTLTSLCYANMFEGCTSLLQAPLLLSVNLTGSCYGEMFKGCSSLLLPPSLLPALTLTICCYYGMFENCTSLTTSPSISATTLAENCCTRMFKNCQALTIPPSLNGVNLAYSCYYGMFENCIGLRQLPSLPALQLQDYCYSTMFKGCTNIKLCNDASSFLAKPYKIPSEGVGVDAEDAMANMFTNTGGDNIGTPEINRTYYCPAMVTVRAQYGDDTLFSYNQMSDQLYNRITYNNNIYSSDNWMGTRIFNTANTIMSSRLVVGLKVLLCSNKVMDKNITITSTWAS